MAVDVNLDGYLQLNEYKEFCRRHCENISRRVGMKVNVVDEEHMEIAWRINQFDGKGGITREDFKKKV